MGYRLYLLLLILFSVQLPIMVHAQDTPKSSATQALESQDTLTTNTTHEITQLSDKIKELTQKAISLKGERLAIAQLEIYDMNDRLRKTLQLAIDSNDQNIEFLTHQVQLQTKYYQFYISYIEKKNNSLQDEIEKATKEERLLMQIPLNELRQAQANLYAEQYQNYIWLQTLGTDTSPQLAEFKGQLHDLAHYTSAALNYSLTHRNALQKQLIGLPKAQADQINLEISYLQRDINTYSKALSRLANTADSLGIDTTELRKELFTATGDITHDLLSWEILKSTISSWLSQAVDWFKNSGPSIIFNLFLFVIIMVFAKILAEMVEKLLKKAVKAPHLKLSNLMQQFIISMSVKIIFCVALLIALAQIGLNLTPVIAGLGVAGIIIGFALQDTLSNFASGMMLLIYRPFDEGDWINAAGVEGTVSNVSLVNTTIRTFDNEVLLVPNSKIWMEVIINRTFERVRRVDMEFRIGFKDSIPQAEKIFEDILASDSRVLKSPEPVVKVTSIGDFSVNFIVRPWVRTENYIDVMRDCTREVKMRFDAAGLDIPYPQSDIHLHMTDSKTAMNLTAASNKHNQD